MCLPGASFAGAEVEFEVAEACVLVDAVWGASEVGVEQCSGGVDDALEHCLLEFFGFAARRFVVAAGDGGAGGVDQ